MNSLKGEVTTKYAMPQAYLEGFKILKSLLRVSGDSIGGGTENHHNRFHRRCRICHGKAKNHLRDDIGCDAD